MPYPNEHACRIRDPDEFQKDSFRRITQGSKEGKGSRDGKQLHIIIGRLKGKTTTTTQAYRYPKDSWTAAQAKEHCEEQNGTFEAAAESASADQGFEIRDFAPGYEKRIVPGEAELRSSKAGKLKIAGHSPVFDLPSIELGSGFIEIVRPGATKKTIQEQNIRGLFNHNPDWILGTTRARPGGSTMRLLEDSMGLEYEISPPDTAFHRAMFIEPIERGDITGSSHGFEKVRDEWGTNEDGVAVRTIYEMKIYDLGPVTFEAFPDADAEVRSLDTICTKCGLDPRELLRILRSGIPGELESSDLSTLREWIDRLVGYMPKDERVPSVVTLERREQLRMVVQRHGLS